MLRAVVLVALLAVAPPAFAGQSDEAPQPPVANPQAPTNVAPVEAKGKRQICVRQGSRAQVGSRIRDPAARMVCRTREEWTADVEIQKDLLNRGYAPIPEILPSAGAGPAPNCRSAGLC